MCRCSFWSRLLLLTPAASKNEHHSTLILLKLNLIQWVPHQANQSGNEWHKEDEMEIKHGCKNRQRSANACGRMRMTVAITRTTPRPRTTVTHTTTVVIVTMLTTGTATKITSSRIVKSREYQHSWRYRGMRLICTKEGRCQDMWKCGRTVFLSMYWATALRQWWLICPVPIAWSYSITQHPLLERGKSCPYSEIAL